MILFNYNGILALESRWLWTDGNIMTEKDYYYYKKKITVLHRSAPGMPAIISYDSLPHHVKTKVDARLQELGELSDVKTQVVAASEPSKPCLLEKYIKPDALAEDFFKKHRYNGDTSLPEDIKKQYYINAIILNAFCDLFAARTNKRESTGFVNKERTGVFGLVLEDLKLLDREKYPHTLPLSERNLRPLVNRYGNRQYGVLIHGNFNNANAEKLNDLSKDWVIARWASNINKCTLFQLFMEYNERAVANGWKELKSEQTIRIFLERPEIKPLWYGSRYGELAAKEKYTRMQKTLLPTKRDALWYGDGTKLNYFYLDENGNVATCSVYEVMDAATECFLGYHISKSEDFETQYKAYKMAMQFSGHKPYEICFDNQGGHKKLQSGTFFKSLTKLAINTQPYNGRSKTIESTFGRFQSQFLHKDWFFTGQNITAKKQESKANMEFILANKANLPTLSEIKKIYEKRRQEWNNALHFDTGKRRIDMYNESINPESSKVEFYDMLFMFGVTTEKAIKYRSNGIILTVKKQKYQYEVLTFDGQPDFDFLQKNIDRSFHIGYDPDDMTTVSLYEKTPAGGLRFITIAKKYIQIHRDKQSQDELDHAFIAAMDKKNKELRLAMQEQTEQILERNNLHPAQHGLNQPKLKGLNKNKTEISVGRIQKRQSELMPALDGEINYSEIY